MRLLLGIEFRCQDEHQGADFAIRVTADFQFANLRVTLEFIHTLDGALHRRWPRMRVVPLLKES